MDEKARQLVIAVLSMALFGASCRREPALEQARGADANDIPIAKTGDSAGDAESQRAEVEFVRAVPREVDTNSGDLRGTRYRADGTSVYGVYESGLSKEVRRLGITIPEHREWFVVVGSSGVSGAMYVDPAYGNLLPTARRLLEELDEIRATDEKRRDVLGRFMTSLRTEKPLVAINTGRMLITEVRGRR